MDVVNLFVYGTLRDGDNVRLLTRRTFPVRKARLEGYQRQSSRSGFPYITPKKGSAVQGLVIEGIDAESLTKLDRYEMEGVLYHRRSVRVRAGDAVLDAETYVGNISNLRYYFGDRIDIDVASRIEKYLEEEISHFVERNRTGQTVPHMDHVEARAIRELLGAEIRALANRFYAEKYVADYEIRKEANPGGLPRLDKIWSDPEKSLFAQSYLTLALSHMIFNQIELQIRRNFPGKVWQPPTYWPFARSSLVALAFLNSRRSVLDRRVTDVWNRFSGRAGNYVALAKKAVVLADELYEPKTIEELVDWMWSNRRLGRVSLGAEIELSELGKHAVGLEKRQDKRFDNFRHFRDFDLGRRGWKLGCHLDTHSLTGTSDGIGGFLEYSLGRADLHGDTSRPASCDVWLLHELINQVVRFVDVAPHSLHLHLETTQPVDWKKKNVPAHLVCLLLLGGDVDVDMLGRLIERRIHDKEIVRDYGGPLHFSLENRHYPRDPELDQQSATVIEYQFPRLRRNADYEALILALKGYQIAYGPRPFRSLVDPIPEDLSRDEAEYLETWAGCSIPVAEGHISEFLRLVERGLMTEADGKNAHPKRYIEKKLVIIEQHLTQANKKLRQEMDFGGP